jgi:hypothetical protein
VSGKSVGDTALGVLGLLNRIDGQMHALGFEPSPAVQKVEKILPFVTQLAQAKSAEEAANVIEAAAVPVSTFEVKSKRNFVAINALAGVTGGGEFTDIGKASASGFVGPFAPVGVNATTPTCFGHFGGFVSVLNLGALVAARFKDDTGPPASDGTQTEVSSTTKVDFINVLSPGAFITFGLGSSPFMLGTGVQVIPARRVTKIAPNGTRSDDSIPAVQALLFGAVDVPIFEL